MHSHAYYLHETRIWGDSVAIWDPFWGLFWDPSCDLTGKTRENMQFIVNVLLHGKTRVKSGLLLDIRKNTAYTHNAALSVVRLTRVLL